MMKAVIISIIARLMAFLCVLGFVFGIVYITNDMRFLWLLWLLLAVEFVPVYSYKGHAGNNEVETKQDD